MSRGMIRLFGGLVVLGFLAGGSVLSAQGLVTKFESREDSLRAVNAILEAKPRSFEASYGRRESPFVAVREVAAPPTPTPVARPEVRRVAPQPIAPTVEPRLSDEAALEKIVGSFQPAGSIIVGDRRLLRMKNGSFLREGSTFDARIRAENYQVEVIRVTPDGYVIGIGTARHSARFIDYPGTPASRPPPAAVETSETEAETGG